MCTWFKTIHAGQLFYLRNLGPSNSCQLCSATDKTTQTLWVRKLALWSSCYLSCHHSLPPFATRSWSMIHNLGKKPQIASIFTVMKPQWSCHWCVIICHLPYDHANFHENADYQQNFTWTIGSLLPCHQTRRCQMHTGRQYLYSIYLRKKHSHCQCILYGLHLIYKATNLLSNYLWKVWIWQ